MKMHKPETGGYVIASVLLVIVAILLFALVCSYLTPKVIAGNCNSFGSYQDILDSFHKGNRGLDGDGDGIPCENRK